MNSFLLALSFLFINRAWCSEAIAESDSIALLQASSSVHHRTEAGQLSLIQQHMEEHRAMLKEQQQEIAALKHERTLMKEQQEATMQQLATLMASMGNIEQKTCESVKMCQLPDLTQAIQTSVAQSVQKIIQGPPGPPGSVGSAGPAGQQGDTGIIGPPGANGAQGPIGPEGSAGAFGPKGDNGDSFFELDTKSQTVHLRDYNLHVHAGLNSGKGNIVVGDGHAYGSCTNCLIAGSENTAEGSGHAVFGHKNHVRGSHNAVSGGQNNEVAGSFSAIGGGQDRKASGDGMLFSEAAKAVVEHFAADALANGKDSSSALDAVFASISNQNQNVKSNSLGQATVEPTPIRVQGVRVVPATQAMPRVIEMVPQMAQVIPQTAQVVPPPPPVQVMPQMTSQTPQVLLASQVPQVMMESMGNEATGAEITGEPWWYKESYPVGAAFN